MTDRQELHTMLDRVPDEDLDTARQLLKELLDTRERRSPGWKMTDEEYQAYLDNAPEEDEELSEEELRGIEEGRAAIRRGEYHSLESVMEEMRIES